MEFTGVQTLWQRWVEFFFDGGDQPVRVLAKLGERDGRAVITRLVLIGDVIDSSTLRSIPIGRAEACFNRYPLPEGWLLAPLDDATVAEMTSRAAMFPEEMGALDDALGSLLAKAPPAPAKPRRRPRKRRAPLSRPDGTDPEGFSRRVAEAYQEVVETTAKPAPLLAAEAGVPVVTVHRWIADARRRGFLPPAKQGRAG